MSPGRLDRLRWTRCSECGGSDIGGFSVIHHRPDCRELQAQDYRRAARELGCLCPVLPPHVHLPSCPMYETPAQMAERLDEEHAE
jgi:hypothetical protein